MNRPLITLGVTTYNAVESAEAALQSALDQTWRPIEIVVVDDASTDGTKELLDRLTREHPEIRVFVNEVNAGVAVSRNRIIKEARGEFIAFFDDDDLSAATRVEKQLERIRAYQAAHDKADLIVCHSARRRIYGPTLERIESTMGERTNLPAPHGVAVARRVLMGTPLRDAYGACPTCSQMAATILYRKVQFDPALRRGEDTDFVIRVALLGGHFVGLSEPLVTQRMTRTAEKSLFEEHRNALLLLEKHRAFVQEHGQYEFCREWLDLKQHWLAREYARFVLRLLRIGAKFPKYTIQRIVLALPNIAVNRAFSRFHTESCPEVSK
jgi:glycosyltransferase involved in cell wall biosynthesis